MINSRRRREETGFSEGQGCGEAIVLFFFGVVFYADDANVQIHSNLYIICQCLGFVLARVPRYNISFLCFTFHRYRGTVMQPNYIDYIIDHLAFFQHSLNMSPLQRKYMSTVVEFHHELVSAAIEPLHRCREYRC